MKHFPTFLMHDITSCIGMRHLDGILRSHVSPFTRWLTTHCSSRTLFIGGLSYDTNEAVLKDAFEKFGEIIEVKVICDHRSSNSKGYGFVRFTTETSASKALSEMQGQLLDGRNIRIEYGHKG